MTYGLLNQRQQPRLSVEDLARIFGDNYSTIAPTLQGGSVFNLDEYRDQVQETPRQNYNQFARMPQPSPEQPMQNGAMHGYPMPSASSNNDAMWNSIFSPENMAQNVSLPTTKENDTYKQYFGNPQDSIWSDYYADKPRDAPLDTNQFKGFENRKQDGYNKYPFDYDWSKIFKMPGPQQNPNAQYNMPADRGNEAMAEYLNRVLVGRGRSFAL